MSLIESLRYKIQRHRVERNFQFDASAIDKLWDHKFMDSFTQELYDQVKQKYGFISVHGASINKCVEINKEGALKLKELGIPATYFELPSRVRYGDRYSSPPHAFIQFVDPRDHKNIIVDFSYKRLNNTRRNDLPNYMIVKYGNADELSKGLTQYRIDEDFRKYYFQAQVKKITS